MKIQHRVMLSATVTICVMATAFTFLHFNQTHTVNAARAIAAAPAAGISVAAAEHLTQAEQAATRTRRLLIGLMIFVVIERALAVFGLVGVLKRHIDVAVDYVRDSASGDLRGELNTMKNNELGNVLGAINHMNQGISTLVRDVRQSALQVEAGARQLTQSSADLSQRTEEQAASLEQTAASMTAFAASLKHHLDTTARVHDSTREAAQVAAHGGTAIACVESTMHEIQGSARRMEEIVALIDGIAFQTNILALNAAVEAARAGEQGRGFGVVASEVRNLAQRASKAAGEIRVLIAQSVAKVNAGAASVTQSGNSMRDMVQSVHNVNTLLEDAAKRAAEQHSRIDEIHHTVNGLERVTSQNAALVQRTNTIADALTREAQMLVEAVSRFKLKETALSPRAAGRRQSHDLTI